MTFQTASVSSVSFLSALFWLRLWHKLKTTQQSRTRGKQGLRIVWQMIHFNSLRTIGKPEISGSVPDQRLKVDTKFDLTRVLVSTVLTEALPI